MNTKSLLALACIICSLCLGGAKAVAQGAPGGGGFGSGNFDDYKGIFEKFTAVAKHPDRGNGNISEVSETIYLAATDELEQLRYPVGADAIMMIQSKQEKGDVAFKKMIAGHFGI